MALRRQTAAARDIAGSMGVAIVLRIIFTGIVATLMNLPWLKLIGALLLFWIAVQLLVEKSFI